MSRVKLFKRQSYSFSKEIIIPINMINYAGHLGNDSLPSLVHEVRLGYLDALGLSELNIGEGLGLVVGDMVLNYKQECFWGDTLLCEVLFDDFKRSSFRAYHHFSREGTTVYLAETGLAAFDFSKRKVSYLPQTFIEKVSTTV